MYCRRRSHLSAPCHYSLTHSTSFVVYCVVDTMKICASPTDRMNVPSKAEDLCFTTMFWIIWKFFSAWRTCICLPLSPYILLCGLHSPINLFLTHLGLVAISHHQINSPDLVLRDMVFPFSRPSLSLLILFSI